MNEDKTVPSTRKLMCLGTHIDVPNNMRKIDNYKVQAICLESANVISRNSLQKGICSPY